MKSKARSPDFESEFDHHKRSNRKITTGHHEAVEEANT